MTDYTVADCDRLAREELDAARAATSRADRERHLNRAAVFAHCSEEGRRDACRNGLPLGGDVPCRPVAERLR